MLISGCWSLTLSITYCTQLSAVRLVGYLIRPISNIYSVVPRNTEFKLTCIWFVFTEAYGGHSIYEYIFQFLGKYA